MSSRSSVAAACSRVACSSGDLCPSPSTEGAGTIAVELDQAGPFDTAVVQIGDGALISGIACPR